MTLPSIKVLTLEINGRKHVLASPIGDRDPMEVTLGEWSACPLLTADAMISGLFSDHRAIRQLKGERG